MGVNKNIPQRSHHSLISNELCLESNGRTAKNRRHASGPRLSQHSACGSKPQSER